MATKQILKYHPDYGVPPGETLLETIQEVGMSQADLASRTGRPLKTINEIVKGRTAITPETALQFERVLGVPASFWNSLERDYQESLAAKGERSRLRSYRSWLSEIPIKELIKRGWVKDSKDEADLVANALNFFGVSSPHAWRQIWTSPQAAFHRSKAFTCSPGAVAAWLRIGELKAAETNCEAFDKSHFKLEIEELRGLTIEKPRQIKQQLVDRCRRVGVAVVFVSELPKTHVSGATQWLKTDKALIQLSCRYKSNDQFWHTFFHEAGHILLHGKKNVFVDTPETRNESKEEVEAHDFAANLLVPASRMRAFLRKWRGTESEIVEFANELQIAAAIVVGQLQHMNEISFSQMNHFKTYQFDLTDE